MASVFLAEDCELGRRVAIKRLHPDSPTEVAPSDPPGSAFARVWGRSIGAAHDVDAAKAQLASLAAAVASIVVAVIALA